MRYFFISYKFWIGKSSEGFGNFNFKSKNFPSNQFIKESADKRIRETQTVLANDDVQVVTLNVLEFKNSKDFKNFTK